MQYYELLDDKYFVRKFSSTPERTEQQCRLLRIAESYTYQFCVKEVKPLNFHDAFKIGIICFVLEGKSFNDS